MIDQGLVALANTMGRAVLIETMRWAAYYVAHSNENIIDKMKIARMREGSYCYMLVQGTGLDTIIDRFALNYDSVKLKEGFNYCLRHKFPQLAV